MKQLLDDLRTWATVLVKAYKYQAQHRKVWFGTDYKTPGATHYGEWYDQDTVLEWPIVVAP